MYAAKMAESHVYGAIKPTDNGNENCAKCILYVKIQYDAGTILSDLGALGNTVC